jgi:hypothetical protein
MLQSSIKALKLQPLHQILPHIDSDSHKSFKLNKMPSLVQIALAACVFFIIAIWIRQLLVNTERALCIVAFWSDKA